MLGRALGGRVANYNTVHPPLGEKLSKMALGCSSSSFRHTDAITRVDIAKFTLRNLNQGLGTAACLPRTGLFSTQSTGLPRSTSNSRGIEMAMLCTDYGEPKQVSTVPLYSPHWEAVQWSGWNLGFRFGRPGFKSHFSHGKSRGVVVVIKHSLNISCPLSASPTVKSS